MHTTAWERRVGDLGFLLESCCKTYFDPELFRRNTNQFLQTARTVTFLIQKDKTNIPDFDEWYKCNVIEAWKQDEVMSWAKDSRNIIEKQGDLDLYSSLDVSLVFSYLEEEDIYIQVSNEHLVSYGIKRLVRLAQKELPTGISDVASVKIARNWVTSNLTDWELLNALVYVYGQHYAVYRNLCAHLNREISSKIPQPADLAGRRAEMIGPTYVKLRGKGSYRHHRDVFAYDADFEPPERVKNTFDSLRGSFGAIDSPETAMRYFLDAAHAVFIEWGNHVPMLHVFDENWQLIDLSSTVFEDQADKYFFWRAIGERVASQKAAAVVWTCELWHRNAKAHPSTAIRNLPIVGEALHVVLLHRTGVFMVDGWNIKRDASGENPSLERLADPARDPSDGMPAFLAPVCRGLGGEAARICNKKYARS